MKTDFSRQLHEFRKSAGLTQEQLAEKAGVSFQAVSKWENSQSYPDIELLPLIASALHADIDTLLGYQPDRRDITWYDEKYSSREYYWGNQFWEGAYDVFRFLPPVKPLRLLDMGCGEGQAAVFFARNGYRVSAFDISENGLRKGKNLARINQVAVDFFRADLLKYHPGRSAGELFDVIYCSGALQYLPADIRAEFIAEAKAATQVNGIHILNVFVEKPFLETPPDWETDREYFWETGELFRYYHDWKIEKMEEQIFDCTSSGVPHRHCMDVLVARKITQ